MAILVDDARWTFRDHLWCHLVSDVSLDELHAFAGRLELPSQLFHGDHYDLPEVYRADAIAAGATAVSSRELVTRLRAAGLRCTPAERKAVKAEQNRRRGDHAAKPGGLTRLVWRTHIGVHDHRFDRLVEHYCEPGRAYHNLFHVDAVLSHVSDLARAEADEPTLDGAGDEGNGDNQASQATDTANRIDLGAMMAAALYHDVIYDPRASDNEAASAELARHDLAELGWEADRAATVAVMIEGTAGHADPPDLASAILFDADLAILGASPEHYERYRLGVREEYSHVSDDDWRLGRPRVLQAYLDRPHIFATTTGRNRWAGAARTNLEQELADLSADA